MVTTGWCSKQLKKEVKILSHFSPTYSWPITVWSGGEYWLERQMIRSIKSVPRGHCWNLLSHLASTSVRVFHWWEDPNVGQQAGGAFNGCCENHRWRKSKGLEQQSRNVEKGNETCKEPLVDTETEKTKGKAGLHWKRDPTGSNRNYNTTTWRVMGTLWLSYGSAWATLDSRSTCRECLICTLVCAAISLQIYYKILYIILLYFYNIERHFSYILTCIYLILVSAL